MQHRLEAGDRLGWVGRHLLGEVEGRVLGAGSRRDPMDEPHAKGLVRADAARGEQQVLGGGEAAERDQPGRADRHSELGAREAHPEIRAAHPQVAGDRDLGTTPHHRAVAGGDRGLRKAGQLVVELGEELHPADPSLLVELLLDVGPGGEPEVVV